MPTRGHHVAHTLRDKVLDGIYAPGVRLTECDLCAELGVSRTPVRSALSMLAAEGLVTHEPNVGYTVRSFTIKDIKGVYDCRAALEGLAARIVAETGLNNTDRGVLHRNIYDAAKVRSRAIWNAETRSIWSTLNEEFHQTIFDSTDNPFLLELIRKTRSVPLLRKLKFKWHDMDFMRETSMDHEEIFEAIITGQSGRAEHLAREHVYRAGRRLAQNWPQADEPV